MQMQHSQAALLCRMDTRAAMRQRKLLSQDQGRSLQEPVLLPGMWTYWNADWPFSYSLLQTSISLGPLLLLLTYAADSSQSNKFWSPDTNWG